MDVEEDGPRRIVGREMVEQAREVNIRHCPCRDEPGEADAAFVRPGSERCRDGTGLRHQREVAWRYAMRAE